MNGIIEVDNNNILLKKEGMNLKIFNSDFRLIRFITMMITQNAPSCIRDINLLEQQISEVIKNAAKHGNEYNIDKQIKIWFKFTNDSAHIIVEDEGDGFKDIEKWNKLKLLRDQAFRVRDFSKMAKYAMWRGEKSTPEDGGNSLFAALEYWNQGVVFNEHRSTIAVKKSFTQEMQYYLYKTTS